MYLKENHAKSNAVPFFRRDSNGVRKEDNFGTKYGLRYLSLPQTEQPESTLGWPLRLRSDQDPLRKSQARNMSVVQWVMSLPNRFNSKNQVGFGSREEIESHKVEVSTAESEIEGDSPHLIEFSADKLLCNASRNHKDEKSVSLSQNKSPLTRYSWPLLQIPAASLDSLRQPEATKISMFQLNKTTQSISESALLQSDHLVSLETRNPSKNMNKENFLTTPRHLVNELELLVRTNSSGCKRFSYAELKLATNQFSSGKKKKKRFFLGIDFLLYKVSQWWLSFS